MMENLPVQRLTLFVPLVYTPTAGGEPWPFSGAGGLPPGEERLFCFEVQAGQARSIEPDQNNYLGPLLFQGKKALGGKESMAVEWGLSVELPAGQYFFAQVRRLLGREAVIQMAAEVQQEALWQRQAPESRLYLRLLSEDEALVTQVFRPVSGGGPAEN